MLPSQREVSNHVQRRKDTRHCIYITKFFRSKVDFLSCLLNSPSQSISSLQCAKFDRNYPSFISSALQSNFPNPKLTLTCYQLLMFGQRRGGRTVAQTLTLIRTIRARFLTVPQLSRKEKSLTTCPPRTGCLPVLTEFGFRWFGFLEVLRSSRRVLVNP